MSSRKVMEQQERARAAAESFEAAYRELSREVHAMQEAVEAAGQDPLEVAGAELLDELEVTVGLGSEMARAIEALREGEAALVEYERGKWGVVPRWLLERFDGSFLGGWFVWVGAVAALLAVISAWYITDYYLEIRDAEAKAQQTRTELQERYQAWLRELCDRDPEACRRAIEAYDSAFAAPAEAAGGSGTAGALAAGSSGLALGLLAALFFLGRKKK
ncbi:MAG: hypothetical protein ACOCUS_04230 [Polyangiales bacterium]